MPTLEKEVVALNVAGMERLGPTGAGIAPGEEVICMSEDTSAKLINLMKRARKFSGIQPAPNPDNSNTPIHRAIFSLAR